MCYIVTRLALLCRRFHNCLIVNVNAETYITSDISLSLVYTHTPQYILHSLNYSSAALLPPVGRVFFLRAH